MENAKTKTKAKQKKALTGQPYNKRNNKTERKHAAMLKPISEFPYGSTKPSNPMHEKLLLLEQGVAIGRSFAIGYYDAIMDVFRICSSPGFLQTEDSDYDERPIADTLRGIRCVLPKQFMRSKGPRLLKGFQPLEEAIVEIHRRGIGRTDITGLLENTKYCIPYLLELNNGSVLVSETCRFAEKGNQFEAFCPTCINGATYHSGSPIPRDTILYATCLDCYGYEKGE